MKKMKAALTLKKAAKSNSRSMANKRQQRGVISMSEESGNQRMAAR